MAFVKRVQTQQWQQSWNNTFQGRTFHTIHPVISSQATFLGTNRGQQRLMSRLRLGRASLNYPQFLTQHHPTGLCYCGQLETVYHYIFQCPLHRDARRNLYEFYNTHNVPFSFENLLSSPLAIPFIITFILDTGKHHILR